MIDGTIGAGGTGPIHGFGRLVRAAMVMELGENRW